MKRFGIHLLAALLGCSVAAAQDAVSFQGKTLTMIIGFAAGGGTDAFGRLAASFLGTYLPGSPTVIVRNVPGAEGITAMNYLVQQIAPDGYTVVTAASTTADPLNYRKPQSHFDPTDFAVIGGAGRGGSAILISKEAEKRLYDKRAAPVVMGTPGGVPRSGMQMTAWGIEFLGWNAKWVVGYRGTSELMLALERGEVDMTATANLFLIQKLVEGDKFKILLQTGTLKNGTFVSRPDFGDAPTLAKLLEGKIQDPLAAKAFEYWGSIASMDKWLALPLKSPKAMVDVYRDAYGKIVHDPEFVDRGKKISDDFLPMSSSDVGTLITALAKMPPEAIEHNSAMLRKQGLPTE
jgi:tripartite-type tricarboxylate transporter receptor subunit TctC